MGDLLDLLRGDIAAFLDYDGTLVPIAPRPELATLPAPTRECLRTLAARLPVAVVTGRGLADIQALVGLPELYYAANHGFEIAGPDARFEFDPALRSRLQRASERVTAECGGVDGVVIESKGYSVAVHYRRVADAAVPILEAAVDQAVAADAALRRGSGKRVFEIRPAADWHKGSAVGWLLERFGAHRTPLYIGDDRTDEDAFAFVRERGVGVFVGEPNEGTAASHRLDDPVAVVELLSRLASSR